MENGKDKKILAEISKKMKKTLDKNRKVWYNKSTKGKEKRGTNYDVC